MNEGTYEENLPCSGKLKVTRLTWEIQYYFPGPDLRHNGTFVTVSGNSIDHYISAFKDNWIEYEHLKSTIPAGGEFTKKGKMGMNIRIGAYHQGVCIKDYHMPICTKHRVESIIDGYLYAKEKAQQIQIFLVTLDN